MAGFFYIAHEQAFTAVDEVVVTHGQNRESLLVRVLFDGSVQNHVIEAAVPSESDPLNEVVVKLTSVQTGLVQVLVSDILPIALPSSPQRSLMRKNKFDAVLAPSPTDDADAGYGIGSRWIDVAASPRREFTCVDATPASAVWVQTTNTIDSTDSPGQYFLGSVLSYSAAAGLPAGEVQYSRVFLLAGLTISSVEVFVDSGGSAARHLRVGMYDQADPDDPGGDPEDRVAQSAEVGTDGADGSYLPIPLSSPFVVPATGFYWVAVVADSSAVKLVVTGAVYRQDFPPVRREAVTGTALPATTGALSNPSSAIAFAAATE